MALLREIWLICTTRGGITGSGADVEMELEINSQGQLAKYRLGDMDGDQFAPPPTKADVFNIDVSGQTFDHALLQPSHFRITNPSNDGWLPESFFIIGRVASGAFHLLLAQPNWPTKWFDADGSSGAATYAASWPLADT
jgi:hypothetical protein